MHGDTQQLSRPAGHTRQTDANGPAARFPQGVLRRPFPPGGGAFFLQPFNTTHSMTKYEIGLTIGRALLAEPATRDALAEAYVDRSAHDTAADALAAHGLWCETVAEGFIDAIETVVTLTPTGADALLETVARVGAA